MPVTHRDELRNALCSETVSRVDLGSTNATGRIVLFDETDQVVAIGLLQNPAFGAPVAGISYPNGSIPDDTAPHVGRTPHRFEVQDRDGAWVWRGTCGQASADWYDPGTPVVSGEPVRFTGVYYRAPY